MECQSSPDGARAQYRIPVIRMQEYGLDEIFMKGLLCLFPYYIMRYEDSLHDINEDDEKLGDLQPPVDVGAGTADKSLGCD